MKTISVFALFAAVTFGQTTLDKGALESYLRRLELWVPQVQVAIGDPKPSSYAPGYSEVQVLLTYNGQVKQEHYYVSSDGKHLLKGDVYDLTRSPFQVNLDHITLDGQPYYGAPQGSVHLVVFGDFQCPYCKTEAESLRANVAKTFPETVRVYFKDFPLEAIHPWARAASIAGRCVFRQGATPFWNFHDWIYKSQTEITTDNLRAKTLAWATEQKLDSAGLTMCIDTKATETEVNKNIQEGLSLGINATPTLFLNGNKFEGSVDWPTLQQLIQFELDYQKRFVKKPAGANLNTPPAAGSPTPATNAVKPAATKVN